MKNYAGHRLAPWLSHLMVSRSETARQLLTPGEIMQLPPDDEIVLLSGVPPIRAMKTRYYQDRHLQSRILPPPKTETGRKLVETDDWSSLSKPELLFTDEEEQDNQSKDSDGAIRRTPELPDELHQEEPLQPRSEFDFVDDDQDEEANSLRRQSLALARAASLNPHDGIDL